MWNHYLESCSGDKIGANARFRQQKLTELDVRNHLHCMVPPLTFAPVNFKGWSLEDFVSSASVSVGVYPMSIPAPIHSSLPPKPMDSLASLSTETPAQPQASSSKPLTPLCNLCTNKYAKYTCPGCSIRTCSLTCSSAHKTQSGCSGQRNKAAYVPMNRYTWGTMVDDYVFLEEMGRKVGEWGKEIVKGGYGMAGSAATPPSRGMGRGMGTRGRGDSRGRGRGGRGRGGGPAMTKRDILKIQLEAKDIEMDLLPNGMERRKLNQSSWDAKHVYSLILIHRVFAKHLQPFSTEIKSHS